MAFEIVDGMTGTKHISSDDLSALNIATIGESNCVLGYGDNFELTMQSANSATLGTGVGMVGGKRFWNQAATNLTVQSGTQGQKRNDLVVARYARTSAGIESITPVVVKGTPSTGTAADPATTSNDLKLWRIPLDGISVGTPVRLFDPVASLATLGDSVSLAKDVIGWQVFRISGLTIASYAYADMLFSGGNEYIRAASMPLPAGFTEPPKVFMTKCGNDNSSAGVSAIPRVTAVTKSSVDLAFTSTLGSLPSPFKQAFSLLAIGV